MAGRTGFIQILLICTILLTIPSVFICIYLYTKFHDEVRSSFAVKTNYIWNATIESFFHDAKSYGDNKTVKILHSEIKMKLKERIISGKTKPLLTLFTTWTHNSDKYLVHNNTIRNWQSFRPYVIPVLFTNETSIASACRQNGWDVLPVRVTAAGDVPVLKFMFIDAMNTYRSTFYAYSNSDILYSWNLVDTLIGCAYNLSDFSNVSYSAESFKYEKTVYVQQPTLIVGRRTNVQNVTKEESSTWTEITSVAKRGELFSEHAEDYFITTRSYPWMDIVEVIIGRRAYDNWLVYNALNKGHIVIDGTATILAVHQTTAAGNKEGYKHRNKDYNAKLLKRLYKNIKYSIGVTGCATYETKYRHDHVVVTNRTVPKPYCFKHFTK